MRTYNYTAAQLMDAEEKQEARDLLYGEYLHQERDGNLLMLTGPRDHESRTALRWGFRLENLYLVDESPANLALHNRSFTKRQRAKMHGASGLLSELCFKWAAEGVRLQAAHLDFCGMIFALTAGKPAVEIPKFIRSGIMENGLLAVTVLSGREHDGCNSDEIRFLRMGHLVNSEIEVPVPRVARMIHKGDYYNPRSNNTMLWAIFDIRRK